MEKLKSTGFKVLKGIFLLGVLLIVGIKFSEFIGTIDVQTLRVEYQEIGQGKFVVLIAVGLLAFIPMCLYDFLLLGRLEIKVGKIQCFKNAWVANSFGNLLNFGGSVAISLRSYFYHTYIQDKSKLIKETVSISLFAMSGLAFLCSIYTFILKGEAKIISIINWTIIVLGCLMPLVILYFFFRSLKGDKTYSYYLKLIVVSVVEWSTAFGLIYCITWILGNKINLTQFIVTFVVASVAGIVSMVPGGLGAFDMTMIGGLTRLGVTSEQAILVLLMYRIFYYLGPFIIGAFFMGKDFYKQLNHKFEGIPHAIVSSISFIGLQCLIFAAGVILLLSAATPQMMNRLVFLNEIVNGTFIRTAHQFSVILGFMLIGLGMLIKYRSHKLYQITLSVLILGAFSTFAKALDYEEALFLVIVGILLMLSKDKFFREGFINTWGNVLSQIFLLSSFLLFYIFVAYENMPINHKHIPVQVRALVYSSSKDLLVVGILGWGVGLVFIYLTCILNRNTYHHLTLEECEPTLVALLKKYNGNSWTHLMYLEDKRFYISKEQEVWFQYGIYADKVVVLGEPIGDSTVFNEAIIEFYDRMNGFGYTPVFYQMTKRMIPYLHESGFDFLDLGEEGYVKLNQFGLSGAKMKGNRNIINRFEREGIRFEVIEPPFEDALWEELQSISKEWLDGRREKGFSLGYFDKAYLNRAPIGLVRDCNNRIIAFVSLMPQGDEKTISIDLMRYTKDEMNGLMDFIFIKLFEWAKGEGYEVFNMGVTPLANVGKSKYAFTNEKIASLIYTRFQFFYSFEGLRKFKSKYVDEWHTQYLGYRKSGSLPFTVIQIILLVSRVSEAKGVRS